MASSSEEDGRTLRSRLSRVVVVPCVVLLLLWAVFAAVLLHGAQQRWSAAGALEATTAPLVNSLVAVHAERRLVVAGADPEALASQRTLTDRAARDMRDALREHSRSAPVAARAAELDRALAGLPAARALVDSGQAPPESLAAHCDSTLAAAIDLLAAQARTSPVPHAALVASEVFGAADRMSRAAALASTALAEGGFTPAAHREFAGLVGAYHAALDSNAGRAAPAAAELHRRLVAGPAWRWWVPAEDALVGFAPGVPAPAVDPVRWRALGAEVAADLVAVAVEQAHAATGLAVADAAGRWWRALGISVAALLAVVAGIGLAVRGARRFVDRALVDRLTALRDGARELAGQRLPDVVAKLEHGERVDVDAERGRLAHGPDEIGQIAQAVDSAHHAAVTALVRENQAKDGLNRVFLGIAHRNQGLVHRQLKVLDRMERHEEQPERLDELFQLDHLITRSRRSAENLIILAGQRPGRRWRKPVRLVDVLRAAVAETEHYFRIRVNRAPEVALAGTAVGDVIHLLAELMDNATAFSSPRSSVHVRCGSTPRGLLVQVHDEGPGLGQADREAANALLADPPGFAEITQRGETRLGLFVVATLAARHRIGVDLRPGERTGTTAFVLLPKDLVAAEPFADQDGAPSGGSPGDVAVAVRSAEPEARSRPRSVPSGHGLPALPRRRRQHSLVPELREAPAEPVVELTERNAYSAERTRGNMAAFQRGTRQARHTSGGRRSGRR
ncbi:sensor histidine kinase [Saccharopolyspora sp. CA-218241]|uniref:sensor histidine kinase n=1 Tax=Saccharopolyspora sp. CA-218241 TaxID=3240027 RepID=UPI003D988F08